MTPLISKVSAMLPYDILQNAVWFDCDYNNKGKNEYDFNLISQLPFEEIAVVGKVTGTTEFQYLLILKQNGNSISVCPIKLLENAYEMMPSFIYNCDEFRGYVTLLGKNGKPEKAIEHDKSFYYLEEMPDEKKDNYRSTAVPLILITNLFNSFEKSKEGYKATPRNSLTNKRRAAKGKGPLFVDWHTVIIAPKAEKAATGANGTHASPRLHERRGHWRNLKGKLIWVKNCIVGDSSKGLVLKDYAVRG